MLFQITHRIHFGYMRELGVYPDLTEADARNLSAPRPGLPNGYGHVIGAAAITHMPPLTVAAPSVGVGVSAVPPEQEPAGEEAVEHTTTETPIEEVPVGTRSNDSPFGSRGPDTASLLCRGCEHKPFKSEAARNAHEQQKHGRVLA
jgi:hypothetical protein